MNPRRRKPLAGLAGLLLLLAGPAQAPAQSAARPVALELVLAVDCSSSVSKGEFDLQIQGIAAAFRHPAVLEAIRAYAPEGIAVSLVLWSSLSNQRLVVGWSLVEDAASAEAFAAAVASRHRSVGGGRTAIGEAVAYALTALAANGYAGARRAIDVSGDGVWNQGRPPEEARALAEAAGVTVNGLAVLSLEPALAEHYRDRVIAGPEAFVLTARRYSDFAEAILRKLLREILGPHVAGKTVEGLVAERD